MSVSSTNPSNTIGGTWIAWGSGRVPVGVNTSDTNFSTVEKTGGSKNVTLTVNQIPAHDHGEPTTTLTGTVNNISGQDATYGNLCGGNIVSNAGDATGFYPSSKSTTTKYKDGFHIDATHTHNSVGGSGSHTNLQPYITCYMWKRTA